jgi:hypothetical protein
MTRPSQYGPLDREAALYELRLDYWLMQARLWVVDALCGSEP